MSGRLAILGVGDLGRRLATCLATGGGVEELLVVGRPADGASFAGMLAACGTALTRFVELDLSQQAAVERFLREQRPDLVVQCGCLMSPWHLKGLSVEAASLIRAAGF